MNVRVGIELNPLFQLFTSTAFYASLFSSPIFSSPVPALCHRLETLDRSAWYTVRPIVNPKHSNTDEAVPPDGHVSYEKRRL
jgi:hypothetical protein